MNKMADYKSVKSVLLTVILFAAATAVAAEPFSWFKTFKPETRCGWFENPTPANAWLIDGQGEWIIATQGGRQADGEWPSFKSSQWVETNGSYGYGCACVRADTNRTQRRIIKIISAYAKPLSACRADKALRRKEPK